MGNIELAPKLKDLIRLITQIYDEEPIPLHRPIFTNLEKTALCQCIDSNFVSTAGKKVFEFEDLIKEYTGARFAIAVCNGTSALHLALKVTDTQPGDEIITQSLTFVATCNAISYAGAAPVFIDVDPNTLSMCPEALKKWIINNTIKTKNGLTNIKTGNKISGCLPMHTFGLPGYIREIADVCDEFGITLIEDAAESLGSFTGGQHTGTFGSIGTISFNGNKIITTGGGGIIITDDADYASKARHLSTTAKLSHSWEFIHDEIGYNYRMPNLNAALGCAQMASLPSILDAKAKVAAVYHKFCNEHGIPFITPPRDSISNNWLNAILMKGRKERDEFLEYTNARQIMTRPSWKPMHELSMYSGCVRDDLTVTSNLVDRIVNLPSSVPGTKVREI